MAGKARAEPFAMQAKDEEIKAVWKEKLRVTLCEHGLEEDLEKLCRRGIYRVQDFPLHLNLFIIDKEKMCGDIHEYHVMYEEEMKKRYSVRFYPAWRYSREEMKVMKGEVLANKKHMSEDVQEVILKYIYSGKSTTDAISTLMQPNWAHFVGFTAPGCKVRAEWHVEPHIAKAALVCKKWAQSYKAYIATEQREVFSTCRAKAVELALNLCDCDEYDPNVYMPAFSRVMYSVYRGAECLFVMRFTRVGGKQHDEHELSACYGIPEHWASAGRSPRSPVRTVALPGVCWIPRVLIHDEELAAFRRWREEQATELNQWLDEQHARAMKGDSKCSD